MNILAIIPARGGSKGIPRKNLHPLAGLPLIVHTIRHAQRARSVTRTVVSTDDAEIAAVSRAWGAEVVDRPPELSGDTASSESALLHVLDQLRRTERYEPDLVVFLQATSPLRGEADVENAIGTLVREEADSLFSSCRVEGFVWRSTGAGPASLSYDFRHRPRRQDAPEDLIENGSIYVFRPWVLRELNNRLGGRIATYRMSPLDSFQIDEPADLEVASRLVLARAATPSTPDLSHVRLLVLDFDGVLTDDTVLVDQDGREAVVCSRSDGWGIAKLRAAGIAVVVLSTEENPVVAARCRKLSVPVVQGCADKGARLGDLLRERGIEAAHVAYVGNDENDLDCLRAVGVPVAVANATPAVKSVARHVTGRRGGEGAVREVVEWILGGRSAARSQRPGHADFAAAEVGRLERPAAGGVER
jgi:YrbI family 3-deoxy-D-manno-octulosonate 8-phosphate phosphatase